MATNILEMLPIELLEGILVDPRLHYMDLLSLGATCVYLRHVTRSNRLWKIKFAQRYKRLSGLNIYDKVRDVDWFDELKGRSLVGGQVQCRLTVMCVTCRSISELSYKQFDSLIAITKTHPRGVHFIIDELMAIVHDNDSANGLTRKYYAYKTLRFMQQYRLASVYRDILNKPCHQQIMEEGAYFISQWQYPDVDVVYNDIRRSLDKFAEDVLRVLEEEGRRQHPVLEVSKATRTAWRDNVLQDNQWPPHLCKQIIVATASLLFEKRGFKVRRCIYQSLPISQELAVKECDPLTISIVFEGILRRLGVKLDLISMSCHFVLGWCESYSKQSEKMLEGEVYGDILPYFCIDTRNEGLIMKQVDCSKILLGTTRIANLPWQVLQIDTSVKMVKCMSRKMFYTCMQNEAHTFDHIKRLRSTLELLVVTEPDHFNNYIRLMDFYDINGIEIDPALLDSLETFLPSLDADQQRTVISFMESHRIKAETSANQNRELFELDVVPKTRDGGIDLKYAIGMVMQHKQYGYKCVIYGWDYKCAASRAWMQTMRVHRLQFKHFQPFYNVLVEDGSLRYAAQENLVGVSEGCEVRVPEIGRYFDRWCGRYYLPTLMKSAEYPDDEFMRNAILSGTEAVAW